MVLLLNSDVDFEPGSLSTLVRCLREYPDVAAVARLYVNPDGTPQQPRELLRALPGDPGPLAEAPPPVDRPAGA